MNSLLFKMIVLLSFSLTLSCRGENKPISDDNLKVKKSSVELTDKSDNSGDFAPAFEVGVILTDRANEELLNLEEKIVVDVTFTTTHLKIESAKKLKEDGLFYLAVVHRKIVPGQVANFDKIMIPRSVLNELSDKNYDVSISIYSEQKKIEKNLLSSEGYFGKISQTGGRRINIHADLIKSID